MLGSGSDARSSSSPNLGTGGPKLASKNSRSSAASPEKNGFGWHIKSLVGADEGSAARVEAYMSLLNASRQTPEPEVPGLFSLPDFAALLSAMSQDIQKEGQPDV